LFEASWKGYRDVAALLIEKGANVKALNSETGSTPLHEAAAKGHSDVVELLIAHGANPSATDKSGATALDRALEYRQAKTVAVFLDHGFQRGNDSASKQLKNAVLRGQEDMVRILLDRGVDPNSECVLHDAALKGFARIADLLVSHGANVNARNSAGATPLHDAALAGQAAVIAILLDRGADINVRDEDTGATPLFNAASWGRVDAVRLLLERGADRGIPNKSGMSPPQTAAANGQDEIVAILKQDGSRK
jgi:ankyrin repeat protein